MGKIGFFSMCQIVLSHKTSRFFFAFTLLGLSLSMAIVLSNIGLMDGYEYLFKNGLRKSSSDIEITNRFGFYPFDTEFKQHLEKVPSIKNVTPIIRTDAFLVFRNKSKGVLIQGIDEQSFYNASGMSIQLETNEVAIGDDLARELNISKGDLIILAFARGNQGIDSLPQLVEVRVQKIIDHGIYQKDIRFIYVAQNFIKNYTGADNRINLTLVNLGLGENTDLSELDKVAQTLREILPYGFIVKTFLQDHQSLIEAVNVEKFSISLILQLIIVISLFNVVAFVIFIYEEKAPEFFLLRSLGLSFKHLKKFWLTFAFSMWLISCALSLVLVGFFSLLLEHLNIFELPAQIYNLSRLTIILEPMQMSLVFLISLVWIMIIMFYGLKKIEKRSIVTALREEFSS